MEQGVKVLRIPCRSSKHCFGLKELLEGKTAYGTLLSRMLDYISFKRLVVMLEANQTLAFNVHSGWLFCARMIGIILFKYAADGIRWLL
jgi:hypothetical protein